MLSDLCAEYSLEQLVNKNTRKSALIDLVYTNSPDMFSNCTTSSVKPHSDHDLVSFNLKQLIPADGAGGDKSGLQDRPLIAQYNFGEADSDILKREMERMDWEAQLEDTHGESLHRRWVEGLEKIAEAAHVPKFTQKERDAHDLERKQLKRQRLVEKLRSKMMNIADRERIKRSVTDVNKEIQDLIDKQRSKEEKSALKNITADPKMFYKYAKRKRSTREKIGPLRSGDTYESDPKRMAQILSDQYKKTFSKPVEDISGLDFKEYEINEVLSDLELTEEDFLAAIKEMKGSSASGPDGVPAQLLKDYAEDLVKPILKIWRRCLDQGILPEGTALALITPIDKGDVHSVHNSVHNINVM